MVFYSAFGKESCLISSPGFSVNLLVEINFKAKLTGQVLAEIRDLPFPAGLLPLLIADLPLRSLVAEHFDLAEGAVDGLVAAVVVAVRVDLQVQRKALHPLLRGEVGAQTVDGDEDLWRENI